MYEYSSQDQWPIGPRQWEVGVGPLAVSLIGWYIRQLCIYEQCRSGLVWDELRKEFL